MHVWDVRGRRLEIGRRPLVMGIVNVTPDSFSDGGRHPTPDAAVEHGLRLAAEGADILDVGGESTRPGATPVPLAEELARVVPVVRGLAARTDRLISVDTSKAEVARRAVEAGAHVVNDVFSLTGDPDMPAAVRDTGAGVVVMHMKGTPQTMQDDPRYDDVTAEVGRFLQERLQALAAAGIDPGRVAVDPGIGFGKRTEHNLTLLARLADLQALGRPVLLGASRKGFIGRVLGERPVDQRLAGGLALVCHAMARGAVQVVRVHDVAATRDAVVMYDVLEERVVRTPDRKG